MNTQTESIKKTKKVNPQHNGNPNQKHNGHAQTKLDTRFVTKYSINVDVKNLKKELRKSIEGEVRFDDGSRALYSTDSSNYRQIPIGVVIPKSEDDIIQIINLCRKYKAPLL